MKSVRIYFFFILCIVVNVSFAQKPKLTPPKSAIDGTVKPKLNYETAANDPYKARIYTLSNGMKVYISVYKDAPRVQTLIAVRAGSKNDPANATGLAHYLEHMVFKGSDKFGTKDFVKENEQIQKVENLFEVYRNTKDEKQRKVIYHQIDSISGVAAKYAIANEYDKMLSALGAQGTNAFTSFDETVYVNDIPNNQIDNWLKIEAERFRKPVLRLFHTELEAVYEEKNRTLDSDNDKAWSNLMASLFQKHSYGTQTTIGTIDHLKNPSMKEINKFYEKNYVPNNMAIILSGDLDPDKTIVEIEKQFGKFQAKPFEPYTFEKEAPITSKIAKEVVGPEADNLAMAWRFNGAGSKDVDMIGIINLLLYNNRAGLMDINLNQAQKVINVGAFAYILKDYSVHTFWGSPKKGQTLEEVEKLIFGQLELLKQGEFEDWLLEAAITELKYLKTKELENNESRAMAMLTAFKNNVSWQDAVNTTERLSKITKQEIIDFVKANYNANNYAIVYKRSGEDKNVEKVEKPSITPVEVDRENTSTFVKDILSTKIKSIEPKYVDFKKDISDSPIKPGLNLYYTQNTENSTFELVYVYEMGTKNDKELKTVIDCFPYLGTSKMNASQVKKELFRLGSEINAVIETEKIRITIDGLIENFDKSLDLFEALLSDPSLDDVTLKNTIDDAIKKREDEKSNKSSILNFGMVSYARYGAINPYTYVLSDDELKKLTTRTITDKIKSLNTFKHHVLFYGSLAEESLKKSLVAKHSVPAQLKNPPPLFDFKEINFGGTVYFADYPMKQVEIMMLSDGGPYEEATLPVIQLYNNYFGGSMSGVVFQDLRESKALAYSAFSRYIKPQKPEKKYMNLSYIGSQSDKLADAIKGMNDLLNNMPKASEGFNSAKELVLQEIQSERITKTEILLAYEEALKYGHTSDVRQIIFEKVKSFTYEDVKKFQESNIKGKPISILVIGDKNNVDMKVLEKYGTIKTLSLKEVFGY